MLDTVQSAWHENTQLHVTSMTLLTVEAVSLWHRHIQYTHCMCTNRAIIHFCPLNDIIASVSSPSNIYSIMSALIKYTAKLRIPSISHCKLCVIHLSATTLLFNGHFPRQQTTTRLSWCQNICTSVSQYNVQQLRREREIYSNCANQYI